MVLNHRILSLRRPVVKPDPSRPTKKTRSDPSTYVDTSKRSNRSSTDQIVPESTLLNGDDMYQRVGYRPINSEQEYYRLVQRYGIVPDLNLLRTLCKFLRTPEPCDSVDDVR